LARLLELLQRVPAKASAIDELARDNCSSFRVGGKLKDYFKVSCVY
jgi:hypothetical protein